MYQMKKEVQIMGGLKYVLLEDEVTQAGMIVLVDESGKTVSRGRELPVKEAEMIFESIVAGNKIANSKPKSPIRNVFPFPNMKEVANPATNPLNSPIHSQQLSELMKSLGIEVKCIDIKDLQDLTLKNVKTVKEPEPDNGLEIFREEMNEKFEKALKMIYELQDQMNGILDHILVEKGNRQRRN